METQTHWRPAAASSHAYVYPYIHAFRFRYASLNYNIICRCFRDLGLGRAWGGGMEGGLELPVFQVGLGARCLTLTGAGDECNLWQPMELTDSWESRLPAVKVSIFKARQLQWEGSRTAHMPALTAKGRKKLFLLSPRFFSTQTESARWQWSGRTLTDSASLSGLNRVSYTFARLPLISWQFLSCLVWLWMSALAFV